MRVDNDQRPDINARYNMGGWPTTAFLTPEGEILAGATYVPPDQMLELLPKVFVYYHDNKGEVEQKVTQLRRQRTTASPEHRGELSQQIYDDILRSVAENYDPLYGGFGEAPKFPHSDAIDLLLYAYRKSRDPDLLHMARKTLEFMGRGEVFDHEWGAFFRYATRRDWSGPHYEKMLEDNAHLLSNVLALYRTTGEQEHADPAKHTIDYLEWKLRDKERAFFYGSQDADEEFYKRNAEQRKEHDEPYIDRTCYTSWNAMMVSAYLEASWTLDRPDLRDAAEAVLEFLWSENHSPGEGMYRFHDGKPQMQGLLGDQAHTAKALLDAYEVTAQPLHLNRATELAEFMLARFADTAGGGFFDIWDANPDEGRLRERQKSVPENTVCAEVFARLHHLTREDRYREIAQGTLEVFVGASAQMGYFAAGYARQVDSFLNPPAEVNIVGQAGAVEALHSAALSLDLPSRVVQVLDPARDAERLTALMLPGEPSPAAYVCLGTTCSAPVTDVDQLLQTVQRMQQSSGTIRLL